MSTPLFRWVVQAPSELAQLLHAQGLFAALADERVFVDGQRASAARELAVGAVVEVYAPRLSASIAILHEVEGVYAVLKPAQLPTEADRSGSSCVLRQLALELCCEPRDLFAISRLDVGVSGVLLVALGSLARDRLLAERAKGALARRYVGLGCGVPKPSHGDWQEALGKSGGKRVVGGRDEQSAHTRYRVVASAGAVSPGQAPTSLLELSPVTGRTHQLRVHAAGHGAPLLGDRKYAGPVRLTAADGSVRSLSQVMLHAAWVEWQQGGKRLRVVSEPTSELVETWLALGGEPSALQRALD